MLEKLRIIFSTLLILLFTTVYSYSELINPNKKITPKEVVEIQLNGLKKNDLEYKDRGIEQTWTFAHPNNKRVTGPLSNFKIMIKGASYKMMINHLSHTITEVGSSDKWAQFDYYQIHFCFVTNKNLVGITK